MGEAFLFAVEAKQPWHIDHPFVHLTALGLPIDAEQPVVHLIGAAEPARQQIDPGAAAQLVPDHQVRQRPQAGFSVELEQRSLQCSHPGHDPSVRLFELTFY